MFCKKCGTQIPDDSSFCPKCGFRFESTQYAPVQNIPTHLLMSILTTLFCCLPFGIVGIVYACQVNSKIGLGDFDGANKASQSAYKWSLLGIVLGVVFTILYTFGVLLTAAV